MNGGLFIWGCAAARCGGDTVAAPRGGPHAGHVSGDASDTCKHVVAAAGLLRGEIRGTCTPEDKAALVADGAVPTAFVGDGVNDTLAIVRAEIGIDASVVLRQNLVFQLCITRLR